MKSKRISIMVVDDHTLVRESLQCILNARPEFEVVGTTGTLGQMLNMAAQLKPGIIMVDVNISPISGFELIAQLLDACPASKIICFSMHKQTAYAKKMVRLGVQGYLTRSTTLQELYEAIIVVTSGKLYICKEIRELLIRQVLDTSADDAAFHSLSNREWDVFNLINKGLTSREIAGNLQLSVKTVEVHRYRILKKLRIKNSITAVARYHSVT